MKKTLIVMFVVCFGIISCGDDNEDVVGTWYIYSEDGKIVDDDMPVQFKADGTFTWSAKVWDSTVLAEGSYTISGDTIRMESSLFGINIVTWVRVENTLTLTNSTDGKVLILKKER